MTSFHVCVPVCVISGKLAAQKIERGQESHSGQRERERGEKNKKGRRLRRHSVDFSFFVTLKKAEKTRKKQMMADYFWVFPLLAAALISSAKIAHPTPIHHPGE